MMSSHAVLCHVTHVTHLYGGLWHCCYPWSHCVHHCSSESALESCLGVPLDPSQWVGQVGVHECWEGKKTHVHGGSPDPGDQKLIFPVVPYCTALCLGLNLSVPLNLCPCPWEGLASSHCAHIGCTQYPACMHYHIEHAQNMAVAQTKQLTIQGKQNALQMPSRLCETPKCMKKITCSG